MSNALDATSSSDNTQLGSVWSQLTNGGNINALDLMKEASGYLKNASSDYKDLAIINKDEKHIQNQNHHDAKAIGWLGKDSNSSLGNAHKEIGDGAEAGQDAAGDTAKGNFKQAAGENRFASHEFTDASKWVDRAIGDRTKQGDLSQQIADNKERKAADDQAYGIIRGDAKDSSQTGNAELKIANIFHQLGLG